jgi:hypothetical protein
MPGVCKVCGCTDAEACVFEWDGEHHTCYWIKPDLCSECADDAGAEPEPLLYDAHGAPLVMR